MSDEHDPNTVTIVLKLLTGGEARSPVTTPEPLDEKTQAQIREQTLIASKTWLTRREASVYLQVSERSIAEWSVRPIVDNPFPVSNAGGEPRYKRERIDEWAETEAQRQRLRLAG